MRMGGVDIDSQSRGQVDRYDFSFDGSYEASSLPIIELNDGNISLNNIFIIFYLNAFRNGPNFQ
jgi:hypothetical protein